MATNQERPSLQCPTCDAALFPAHGRGRIDRHGNEVRHRDECRCRWCNWWWTVGSDDEDFVTCACGAVVGLDADDGTAFTYLDVSGRTP